VEYFTRSPGVFLMFLKGSSGFGIFKALFRNAPGRNENHEYPQPGEPATWR
jgi:hypothetical protein